MVYNVEKLGTINIGRHGENLARVIKIDVSSMLKKWPDATIALLVKRNKDEAPYVAVTELVDGILYWPVTRAETAVPGNGLIEIRATCGETIAKSITGFIRVSAALTGNETEPPETAKSWVDQVIEYGNEATQAAIKAKEEADRLSGINAKAVTLPAGSDATVTVEKDCLVYGIPRGDKGDPGTDATVTNESIKDALGYTPADDAAMAGKLTEPATGIAVGKYFRIAAIDENGHAVLEAVDANVGGLSTEPSLWPAWTRDEQAAARERIGIGNFELLEESVFEETVTYTSRNKDNQGNAYCLNAIIIYLVTEPDESSGAGRCAIYSDDGYIADYHLSNLNTTKGSISTIKAYPVNGCWEYNARNSANVISSTTGYANLMNAYIKPILKTGYIKSFYISGKIVAGSKLMVYGVRA